MKTEAKQSLFKKPSVKEASETTPKVTIPPYADAKVVVQKVPTATSLTVQPFDLRETKGEDLVLFGNDRQKQFGNMLDEILKEVTKGTNPVLFELFNQLSKGVAEVNIPELEEEIRNASKTGIVGRALQAVGLSSAATRLQKANDRINVMLKSKSTSLLEICQNMQDATQKEVLKLIEDSQRLQKLAVGLNENVNYFRDYVIVGRQVLENAKTEYSGMEIVVKSSNDERQIADLKDFNDKISLFENRLLVLETILQKAPTDLEAIRIGLNASLSTLGETANSALEDFNDIKSILLKLTVTHQIGSVQALNEQRRQLKEGLQSHANQQLANVAVNAAKSSGINRLKDTELLLKSAKDLADINVKVKAEQKENENRFAEARLKLTEIRSLVNK